MGTHWIRTLRPVGMPYLQIEVEDGQGDRRQENGRPSLFEVERNGAMQFPATTASRVRHLQELRRSLSCCFHGRQRCGHAWQGHLMREEGGGRQGRQEEMSAIRWLMLGSKRGPGI